MQFTENLTNVSLANIFHTFAWHSIRCKPNFGLIYTHYRSVELRNSVNFKYTKYVFWKKANRKERKTISKCLIKHRH